MASFVLRKKQSQVQSESGAAVSSSSPDTNSNTTNSNVYGACHSVFDYERIDRIGEGTFGLVYKARHKETGRIVALKRVILHNETSDGFPLTSLREITILKRLQHPHIVNLLDIVVGAKRESVFLCFEYCQTDLASILDSCGYRRKKDVTEELARQTDKGESSTRLHSDASRTCFSEPQVKLIMKQLLSAVDYMHENWTVHRDIKMSNLLYHKGTVKLADFGLAREIHYPAEPGDYTTRVVTLWYRAPELLLGADIYDVTIDMWSIGCIFAELLLGVPLFNGGVETEQIERIFSIMGSPNEKIWPGFRDLPMVETLKDRKNLFNYRYNRLPELLPNLSETGMDLINSFLAYDPDKRISAKDALNHAYFGEYPYPSDIDDMPTVLTESDKSLIKRQREQYGKSR